MKKIAVTSVVALLVSVGVMAQVKKVAVIDPVGDIPNATRDIVREEISSGIVNMPGYTVLERSLIDKILEENKFQTGSGLVDDSQISKMGMMMGANFVFITSVTIMENGNYYISCKMVDVLTSRIDKQRTARTRQGPNDLIDVVENVILQMFGQPGGYAQSGVQQASAQRQTQPQAQQQQSKGAEIKGLRLSSGIVIMPSDLPDKYMWRDAVQACPKGWRLPTTVELGMMCKDKKYIGNLTGRQYWTSNMRGNKAVSRTINDCEEEAEKLSDKHAVRCIKD